jgi:hypothetical protein
MPTLKIDLDPESYDRLIQDAARERRPVLWQAAVTLRRALSLPFPPHVGKSDRNVAADHEAAK